MRLLVTALALSVLLGCTEAPNSEQATAHPAEVDTSKPGATILDLPAPKPRSVLEQSEEALKRNEGGLDARNKAAREARKQTH